MTSIRSFKIANRLYMYHGKAIVAITSETPIKIVYEYRTSQVMNVFTVQRYNERGEGVDSTVQAQINKADTF